MPKERVMLEDEPDPTITRLAISGILSVQVDRTRIGQFQSRNDAQQRRFARPGWTDQRDELSRRCGNAYVLKHDLVAECLSHVPYFDAHD
jgi:hypothetical protein